MTKMVVATTNHGKLTEFEQLLPASIEAVSLDSLGVGPPIEDGDTFLENAMIKARNAFRAGFTTIADDSGLVVDALGGMPGIRSSRFAGEGASDAENNQLLIEELAGVAPEKRSARFQAAVVLIDTSGAEYVGEASLNGVIVLEPRGRYGFGYDPLFEIRETEDYGYNGRTMAELTAEQKASVSHRSRAYKQLVIQLARCHDLRPELWPLVDQATGGERL